MKEINLVVSGEVSSYYAQTLCLLLWPRAKFPPLEESALPKVVFSCVKKEDGFSADVEITLESGEVAAGSFFAPSEEKIYIESASLALGRAFIIAAVKCGMKISPWGLLTGVRPAKPILSALLSGRDTEHIKNALEEKYLLSPDKAELCTEVAKNEYAVIKDIKADTCSIYISVPFCPTRCSYCSFISYALPNLMALIPEYLEHICADIEKVSKAVKKLGLTVCSVYIGGGTPTSLDEKQLERLCDTVCKCFAVNSLREFCVEAGRPDTITEEKLKILKAHGVSRISINPQTLHDNTLELIGRRHTVKQFYEAYALAEKIGFDKNVDLIAGLPSETGADFLESVNGILRLSPENITVHTFCVKKAADLAAKESEEHGDIEEYQKKAYDAIYSAGYIPYYTYRQKNAVNNLENTGFAKKGHEGVYNIIMMEETGSVIGIGAGASTRLIADGGKRLARTLAPKYPYEYKNFDISEIIDFINSFYDK